MRTARVLFRGPLPATGAALTGGELSAAHASVLAAGTKELPDHVTAEAEPLLVEAARRLDPPRLRRVVAHLCLVADPEGADRRGEERHQRRGVWLASTWEGMVALDGLLEPEAGQIVLAALEALARPTDAADTRSGGQRTADALAELARRQLASGRLPQTGGVRPQLTVTVDLDSLLGRPDALGVSSAGPGRWLPRPVGGWPVTGQSPGRWSAASPATSPAPPTRAGGRTDPGPGFRPGAQIGDP